MATENSHMIPCTAKHKIKMTATFCDELWGGKDESGNQSYMRYIG